MEHKEKWKDIKEYEGLYQISNLGRVKSLSRLQITGTSSYWSKERILKPRLLKGGYLEVSLCKNSKLYYFRIHRLVAIHFIDNTEQKPQVNHLDGCKINNIVTNLEWCTRSENIIHACKTGLMKPSAPRGENNSMSKLTDKQVAEIRRLKNKNIIQRDIGKLFNITQGQVSKILSNKCRQIT